MADPVHTAGTLAPAAPEPHEASAFGLDPGGWVALSMVAVILVLLWKKVPAIVAGMLDKQIVAIREHLDAAAKLRQEAETLKAQYEARANALTAEAEVFKATAAREADRIIAEAKVAATALIARRQKLAEDKIAAAERATIAELRARAVDTAIDAATGIIAKAHDGAADALLVNEAIAGL